MVNGWETDTCTHRTPALPKDIGRAGVRYVLDLFAVQSYVFIKVIMPTTSQRAKTSL